MLQPIGPMWTGGRPRALRSGGGSVRGGARCEPQVLRGVRGQRPGCHVRSVGAVRSGPVHASRVGDPRGLGRGGGILFRLVPERPADPVRPHPRTGDRRRRHGLGVTGREPVGRSGRSDRRHDQHLCGGTGFRLADDLSPRIRRAGRLSPAPRVELRCPPRQSPSSCP